MIIAQVGDESKESQLKLLGHIIQRLKTSQQTKERSQGPVDRDTRTEIVQVNEATGRRKMPKEDK